jgi:hypothetical protein
MGGEEDRIPCDMRNVAEDRRIILMGCEEDTVWIEMNTVRNLWVQ